MRRVVLSSVILVTACTSPTPEPDKQPEPDAKIEATPEPELTPAPEPTPEPAPEPAPSPVGLATPVRAIDLRYADCSVSESGWLSCDEQDPPLTPEVLASLHPADAAWFDSDGVCARVAGVVRCALAKQNAIPLDADKRLVLPTEAEVIDLAWDLGSACAVTSDGAVWCVHGNYDSTKPMRRFPIVNAVGIEIDGDTGCALLEGPSVRCWLSSLDSDEGGTLRDYCSARPDEPGCDEIADASDNFLPAPSHSFPGARDVAIGIGYTCVLGGDGVPLCLDPSASWDFVSVGDPAEFAPIQGVPPLVAIEAGSRHVCGHTKANEVWCWGANDVGQLGDGTTQSSKPPKPVRVGEFPKLMQLAVANYSACVLTDDRQRHCWGWRDDDNPPPSEIADLSGPATALEIHGSTTCARVGAGWKCWGGDVETLGGVAAVSRVVDDAPRDQIGDSCQVRGDRLTCTDDDKKHVDVADILDVERRDLSSVCVLVRDQIQCHDPFGFDSETTRPAPGATAISGFTDYGCVLTKAGEVWCWAEDQAELQRIDLPGRQVRVTAHHIGRGCALDEAGAVRCWELGRAPVQLPPTKISQLAASIAQSCALDQAGAVWCWEAATQKPAQVELPAAAVEIELGDAHGCARLDDGRVHCWGSASAGERGALASGFVLRPVLSR